MLTDQAKADVQAALAQLRELLADLARKEAEEMRPRRERLRADLSDDEGRYCSRRLGEIAHAYSEPKNALRRQLVKIIELLPSPRMVLRVEAATIEGHASDVEREATMTNGG